MNLYDYLSYQVPNDCFSMMQQRAGGGLRKPRNPKQLAQMLRKYVSTFGQDALQDIASIHPDKDLLSGANPVPDFGVNEVGTTSIPKTEKDYVEVGCKCGGKCGGNCGKKKSCGCQNAEQNFSNLIAGENNTTTYTQLPTQSKAHEILIGAGVILLGLAVLLKVVK